MSGLERLRKFIEANPTLLSYERDELRSIVDEIGNEIDEIMYEKLESSWFTLGEYINGVLDGRYDFEKPGIYRRFDNEPFREWLDRWYLPRPVVDGEPVQFGDEFKVHGGRVYPVSGFYIFSESPDKLYFETGIGSSLATSVDNAERAEPDSIEKLRGEMCASYGCVPGSYDDCEIREECEVHEWLSRAKKLFGGDGE